MAGGKLETVLRHIRQLTAGQATRNSADVQLLDNFAERHDQAAFAELVRRHRQLVWGVCRHVLQHDQDAEDAFQATFLALALKAATLRKVKALAGWLHGAAFRSAMQIKRQAARRRHHEQQASLMPRHESPSELAWQELQAVLDEEVLRLPEKYQAPFVLCCLEGKSKSEAARQLGWKEGTVSGRLAQARKLLQKRLTRRGVSLSAVLCGTVLSQGTTAATVPIALAQATVGVAAAVALSGGLTGAVSAKVAAAVKEATKVMWLTKCKLITAVIFAIASAAGVGVLGMAELPQQKTDAQPPSPAQAARSPKPAVVKQFPTDTFGDPLPAGAVARLGTRRLCGPMDAMWAGFSPDGTKVASQGFYAITVWDAVSGVKLVERPNYNYEAAVNAIGWRRDGTGVAVVMLPDRSYFVSAFTDSSEKQPTRPAVAPPVVTQVPNTHSMCLSPDATQLAVVPKPDGEQVMIDLLPATPGQLVAALKPERSLGPFPGPCREIRYTTGGRLLILCGRSEGKGDWTIGLVDSEKNRLARSTRVPPPGSCIWRYMLSVSADARLAAIAPGVKQATNAHDGTIRVWDLAAGRELWSFPFPKCGYGTGHAFAPDGKRLITSTDKTFFQIWDLSTGREAGRSPFAADRFYGREASAIAVSPDGKRFATFRRDGRVDIWETETGKAALPLATHRNAVGAVAVSPDGRQAATHGYDGSLRVWDLTSGRPGCVIAAPLEREPNSRFWSRPRPAFTPDGRGLLFTAGAELALADPATGKPLDLPDKMHRRKEKGGGFSADRKTLATFADDVATVWDWPAGTARCAITVPLGEGEPGRAKEGREIVTIKSIALSPNGRLLFTNSIRWNAEPAKGGEHNANDVWDARTGKHLHRLRAPATEYPPAVFSADGRVMYLGGSGFDNPDRGRKRTDALTMWDPATGTLLRRFADANPGAGSGDIRRVREEGLRTVDSIALSPDGRLLAAAEGAFSSDRSVCIYETASGAIVKKFSGHLRPVTDLAFTPDGRRLVSVSEDQTGLVWDVTLPALGGKAGDVRLTEAWDGLAAHDSALAYASMAALSAAPAEAVQLLRAKLRSAPVPSEADLDRLIKQLDAEAFAEREKAMAELERFGPNALAGIKTRLERGPSLEIRKRLARFVERYEGPNPYQLRCVRCVAVLEAIGTAGAKALLTDLAKGPLDDVLTREAVAAIRRNPSR